MFMLATKFEFDRSTKSFRTQRDHGPERGSALLGTLIVLTSLLGLLYAASRLSTTEVKESRHAVDDVQSKYLADAGVESAIHFLGTAVKNASVNDPLHGLTHLFEGGTTLTTNVGTPVMNGTRKVGAYSVSLTEIDETATSVTVEIDATGYLPDAPSSLPPGKQVASWHAVKSTVRYSLAPSKVFDYAYFINNWGWFYGDTIRANGNVRSNGQFDSAGYSPTVTGQPLYDAVAWNGTSATLSGYQDDNHDGLKDGNDGGVWSGWNITGAQNVRGNGGHASNQHDFQPPISMPNLSDLGMYEASAIEQGSSISIDGVPVSNAVCGDEPGEKQNLYLVGTIDHPIQLHGPIVVRGNVVISGYVTGQGAIYAGGNIYCPNSVIYKNGPSTTRPADNTQASTEQWISNSWNKDFLGLFAKKNIAVGDFTDSTWQHYESLWMNNPLNASAEDAGADGIPNTKWGKDGIPGTADDDVLEGDGIFTISHYTAADLAAGLIPPGHVVGDPIPGTGEDINGNGVHDGTTTLADVTLSIPLNTANWSGNMPSGGISNYHDIASMTANRLDAVFYTNNAFCYTVLGGTSAKINGALVSRNENIIYGTPTLDFNYDCRLLGGSSGMASKLLPITVQPVEVLRWTTLDRDPNRHLVAP